MLLVMVVVCRRLCIGQEEPQQQQQETFDDRRRHSPFRSAAIYVGDDDDELDSVKRPVLLAEVRDLRERVELLEENYLRAMNSLPSIPDDEMSLLEFTSAAVVDFVKTRLLPKSSPECRWHYAKAICVPTCKCAFRYKPGDLTPSRACRVVERPKADCDDLKKLKEEKGMLEKIGDAIDATVSVAWKNTNEFLQEAAPRTDADCDFDWSELSCEPKNNCVLRYKFGDYHIGRACRKKKELFTDYELVPSSLSSEEERISLTRGEEDDDYVRSRRYYDKDDDDRARDHNRSSRTEKTTSEKYEQPIFSSRDDSRRRDTSDDDERASKAHHEDHHLRKDDDLLLPREEKKLPEEVSSSFSSSEQEEEILVPQEEKEKEEDLPVKEWTTTLEAAEDNTAEWDDDDAY